MRKLKAKVQVCCVKDCEELKHDKNIVLQRVKSQCPRDFFHREWGWESSTKSMYKKGKNDR